MSFGRLGGMGRGFGHLGSPLGGAAWQQPLLTAYTGAVATRGRLNSVDGFNAGNTALMTRTTHWARDSITALQLVYPNWYVNPYLGTELGTGNIMKLNTSIEYPAGTFTQVKWSGVAQVSLADGTTGISDLTSVTIPKGAQFWVRTLQQNAAGCVFIDGHANSAIGDRMEFTATDKTLSGTVADSLPNFAFGPAAIVATTQLRSVLNIGTSRSYGNGDTIDSSGDTGIICRSIGPFAGYCNAGIASDRASNAKSNFTKRTTLLPYFSDVFVELGANDSTGTLNADLVSVYNLCTGSGRRVHGVTLSPNTTGAWTLANGSDQTVGTNFTSVNTLIRTVPAPLTKMFDIAPVVSLPGTPTKWNADGTAGKYTTDGVHETQFACLLIKSSGIITQKTLG